MPPSASGIAAYEVAVRDAEEHAAQNGAGPKSAVTQAEIEEEEPEKRFFGERRKNDREGCKECNRRRTVQLS